MVAFRPMYALSFSVAALIAFSSCTADEPFPKTGITRIQAFYCATRGQAECYASGAAIPSGQSPPKDEAFLVWVWHPGFNTTKWRLVYAFGTDSLMRLEQDSAVAWFHLSGAEAKRYVLQIQILGSSGVVSQDSLVWVYP